MREVGSQRTLRRVGQETRGHLWSVSPGRLVKSKVTTFIYFTNHKVYFLLSKGRRGEGPLATLEDVTTKSDPLPNVLSGKTFWGWGGRKLRFLGLQCKGGEQTSL